MLVQEFLRTNSLDALIEKYKISVSNKYDDIVVLNYSQIESPKHDPLVKECRGLILERDSWNVVARSFDRFFNYGECPRAEEHDISKALVQQKIDGSLCTVYFWNGKWNVATRKMAYAEGENAYGTTFRQVFDKAFDLSKMPMSDYAKIHSFAFELVSPETRVVTRYPEPKVYLIGARNNRGDEFYSWELDELARGLSVPRPKVFSMSSFEEVVKNSRELPSMDEGYVCVWESSNGGSHYRLKIKNPAYLAIAHMRENGEHSEKRVICLVMKNDYAEYLSYFPEDTTLFQKYIDIFSKMKDEVNENWEKVKNIENQKEFALQVKDLNTNPILFRMKKGKSIDEVFETMTDAQKVNIFSKFK